MRGLLFTAIIAATAATACAAKDTVDPGPVTARNFQVGDFKHIESAGSYEVTVRTGARPSVRAEGPQNIVDRLIVEVRGDRLSIRPKKGNFHWGRSEPVRIAVTVPELREASTAGSGSISVDKVAGDRFKATITGSGDVSLPSVNARSVQIEVAGSGSGRLAGRADEAQYVITGSGEVDASKLKSRDVRLTIAGSGSLAANASGNVSGEVLGSGAARISGGARCSVTKAGSGSVACS